MKKQKLKDEIIRNIDEIVDGVELIGDLNFFEIGIKVTNGNIMAKLGTTYKT